MQVCSFQPIHAIVGMFLFKALHQLCYSSAILQFMQSKFCNRCGRALWPYGGFDPQLSWARCGRGRKVQRRSAAFHRSVVYCCRRNTSSGHGHALRKIMWNDEIVSMMSLCLFGTAAGQRRSIRECVAHRILAGWAGSPFSHIHVHLCDRMILTLILRFVF